MNSAICQGVARASVSRARVRWRFYVGMACVRQYTENYIDAYHCNHCSYDLVACGYWVVNLMMAYKNNVYTILKMVGHMRQCY